MRALLTLGCALLALPTTALAQQATAPATAASAPSAASAPPAASALPALAPPAASAPPAPATPAPIATPTPPARAPAPAPARALDEDVLSTEMPFFDPLSPFKPPPPPPPPAPSWLLSGFFRLYHFSSPVSGFVPHVGATVGGRVASFMLGGLPSEGLASIGVMVPRFTGATLSSSGGLQIALLGPSFEAHAFSDFSDNFQLAAGASLLGLGVSTCSVGRNGPAMFVQLRLPMVHVWAPFLVNGEAPDRTKASPYFSVGAGLEVGVVFF